MSLLCGYTNSQIILYGFVVCVVGRLQTKNDKEKVRKLLMLWLERLQRTEPGQHITFILDTYKTAMSNVDLGMIRFIIDSFSTYFPDLLGEHICSVGADIGH